MSRPFGVLGKLRESASFDFGAWLSDLTYAEIHEFTKGGGLAFLGALADSTLFWQLVAGYSLVVTVVVALDRHGLVDVGPPTEHHYFLGGVVAGSLLAVGLGLSLV